MPKLLWQGAFYRRQTGKKDTLKRPASKRKKWHGCDLQKIGAESRFCGTALQKIRQREQRHCRKMPLGKKGCTVAVPVGGWGMCCPFLNGNRANTKPCILFFGGSAKSCSQDLRGARPLCGRPSGDVPIFGVAGHGGAGCVQLLPDVRGLAQQFPIASRQGPQLVKGDGQVVPCLGGRIPRPGRDAATRWLLPTKELSSENKETKPSLPRFSQVDCLQ